MHVRVKQPGDILPKRNIKNKLQGLKIQYITPPTFVLWKDPLRVKEMDVQIWANSQEYLMQNGYVVFRNIISNNELSNLIVLFQNFLHAMCPTLKIEDDDKSNGGDDDDQDMNMNIVDSFLNLNNWKQMSIAQSGLLCNYGIGQSKFMWTIKNNTCLKLIYNILNANKGHNLNLVTSMEGCRFIPSQSSKTVNDVAPPSLFRSVNAKNNLQEHILKPNYQSFIQIHGGDKSGFCFLKNSHLQPMIDIGHIVGLSDICPLQQNDFIWDLVSDLHCLIGLQAGDVVLLNPLLVHGFSSPKNQATLCLQAFVSYYRPPCKDMMDRMMQVVQKITVPYHPLPNIYHPLQIGKGLMHFPNEEEQERNSIIVDYDALTIEELKLLYGCRDFIAPSSDHPFPIK